MTAKCHKCMDRFVVFVRLEEDAVSANEKWARQL